MVLNMLPWLLGNFPVMPMVARQPPIIPQHPRVWLGEVDKWFAEHKQKSTGISPGHWNWGCGIANALAPACTNTSHLSARCGSAITHTKVDKRTIMHTNIRAQHMYSLETWQCSWHVSVTYRFHSSKLRDICWHSFLTTRNVVGWEMQIPPLLSRGSVLLVIHTHTYTSAQQSREIASETWLPQARTHKNGRPNKSV